MHGKLRFNNVKIDFNNLNILEAIKQLKDLKNVNFIPGSNGISYIDALSNLFYLSSIDEDAVLLLPNFRKAMKNILSNSENMQKFKELGATNLDIALVEGNIEAIRDIAARNVYSDPFAIAKEWRLYELGLNITTKDDINFNKFFDVKLNINGELTSMSSMDSQVFNYQKLDFPSRTMLINIQDFGDRDWNYHLASLWHNALAPSFDQIAVLGHGGHYILNDHKLALLNLYNNHAPTIPNLNFALVILGMHDAEQGRLSEIIKQLPQNLAKETVYFIDCCYSGQYHKDWSGNAHLVTSTTADTGSYSLDSNKIINLPSYWQDKNPSLKGLLQFLAEQYEESTPHYTGTISDIKFVNSPVKDAVTLLWSSDHGSIYPENSLEKPRAEVTFIGLTDLLKISNTTSITESLAQETQPMQEDDLALLGTDTLELL